MFVDDIAKWPMPRALNELCPHGLSGFDKGGSPGKSFVILPHTKTRCHSCNACTYSPTTTITSVNILSSSCTFIRRCPKVIIVPFAGLDMFGLLHACTRAEYIRGTIKNLEMYMRIGFEQSVVHGPGARQFVILFDLKDFNLRQYTWRPAGEVIIALIKAYEANYPEILKACYLINGNVYSIVSSLTQSILFPNLSFVQFPKYSCSSSTL